ncbi:endonuclease domain-containing protein [Sphingobium sp. Cam5-1]|uniref:endonuclease domain-containing protein n=1 Tax=Sphingobium sp. Cam5-1 TaxID=2789327 RepID=UPI0018AD14BC|nr:endonuclease domain-containing protein [Sphingobium sp. Cam5-1]QPI72397.1 endonuclease domain-containing protein [Sphingobium sp. Cam5-1]
MGVRRTNPNAAMLRQNATECEKQLWAALRNRQLDGFKFRRQATIGPYVVDLLCAEHRLIVEVDGGQHGDEADLSRTRFLERQGYSVIRFWNHEVIENLDGVLESVRQALPVKQTNNKIPTTA